MNTGRPGNGRCCPAKLVGQFVEQPGNAVLLDLVQGDLVDARCAVIDANRDPRAPQDVPAYGLVPQRVEPSPRGGWPPGTACVAGHAPCPSENAHCRRDQPNARRSPGTSITTTRIDEVVTL